jgi:transposase InsO family protein
VPCALNSATPGLSPRVPVAGALSAQRRGRVADRPVQDRGDSSPRPWSGLDQVEIATLEWVDWFNNRQLHSACGNVPPAEYEQQHYRQIAALETLEAAEPSLH